MGITNVLASVAVRNVANAAPWYERLLGEKASHPMPEIAEWRLPRGGCLQVYQLPERAGSGSFTLSVEDIDAEIARISKLDIDTSDQTNNSRVRTFMIQDPDGNHIAFAETLDPLLAK